VARKTKRVGDRKMVKTPKDTQEKKRRWEEHIKFGGDAAWACLIPDDIKIIAEEVAKKLREQEVNNDQTT
jgi:hypothetical protein